VEQYSNAVHIIKKRTGSKSDNLDQSLYTAGSFDHPYPCTKLLWSPDIRNQSAKDLLATTGDYLRIWRIYDDPSSGANTNLQNVVPKKEVLLNNNKTSEYCAPLTSFDWNETDPTLIGTSSIDTTCTIWDLEAQTARTQLIAHDKEVFDIAFARYVWLGWLWRRCIPEDWKQKAAGTYDSLILPDFSLLQRTTCILILRVSL
jgi:WD repeat-containing protein 68